MSTEITVQDIIIIIWISSGTVFENKFTIELSVQFSSEGYRFHTFLAVRVGSKWEEG